MINLSRTIITPLAVYAVLVAMPGPNFFVVTRTAITASRRSAFAAALGVATASTVFAFLSLLGLSYLLSEIPWIPWFTQIAGGGYVIYLGLKAWIHATDPVVSRCRDLQERVALHVAWRTGFITNITNPKSIAFFAGLFAFALTPKTPTLIKAMLIVSVGIISLTWYSLVVLLFSSCRFQKGYSQAKTIMDRLIGAVLIVVGAELLISSH